MVVTGTYTEVDPPARIAYTVGSEPMPGVPQMPESTITIEFVEVDGGTEMRFKQTGLMPEICPHVSKGTQESLDKLEKLLEATGAAH